MSEPGEQGGNGAVRAPRRKARARQAPLQRDLHNRLRRAEGQLRGVGKMIAEDAYCIDVLQQIAAVRRALDKIALILLRDHLQTCVADAIGRNAAETTIAELIDTLDRYLA